LTGRVAVNEEPSAPPGGQADKTIPQGPEETQAVRQIEDGFDHDFGPSSNEPQGICFGSASAPKGYAENSCFPASLGQAQVWKTEGAFVPPGTMVAGVKPLPGTGQSTPFPEMINILKQRFGGRAAAGNPAYSPNEIKALEDGYPIDVSKARLDQILGAGQNGNQWLVFIKPNGASDGHIFNVRIANNAPQYLDVTQKGMDGMWLLLDLAKLRIYQLY